MGICQSKPNVLSHLDDSVKVMVRHDAKILEKKGQTPGGYVPRAPHPMFDTDDRPSGDEMANGGDNSNGYGNEGVASS
jgi:hypothetical protein